VLQRHVGLQLRVWVGLLATTCALALTTPARADPFDTGGGGVFLGYAIGERGGFEWGLEGFATHYFEPHPDCGDVSARHGLGPLLRLSAVKVSRLELTLAAHGGGDLLGMRPFFDIDGEVGASLFLEKEHTRVAPHTGVTLESIIFNLYFRQEWLEPSYSVGGGARYLPTFGSPGICQF
jgi:hypothetical protein